MLRQFSRWGVRSRGRALVVGWSGGRAINRSVGNNNNNKDILTGSPHHKKVVFSGALLKISNKYDKNDLKVKVKNRGCKKLNLKNEYKKF